MNNNDNFLVNWSKRGQSTSENVNFLWKKDRIYIMDNHRCALWSWGQELDKNKQYNFFHLDAHYDASDSIIQKIPQNFDLKNCNLKSFLEIKDPEFNTHLFRWDNYLPVSDQYFNFRKKVAFTQQIGKPWSFHFEYGPEQLIRQTKNLFVDELTWVINLDLDYFYGRDFKESPFIHVDYIKAFFEVLHHHYKLNEIEVITLALSPECCGGWAQAEKILQLFEDTFSLHVPRPTL